MKLIRPGFYWPLHHFWTFNPFAWCCALVWNLSELMGWALPGAVAPWIFGIIMERKPRKCLKGETK